MSEYCKNCKALQDENDKLQKRVEELEAENKKLKKENDELEGYAQENFI